MYIPTTEMATLRQLLKEPLFSLVHFEIDDTYLVLETKKMKRFALGKVEVRIGRDFYEGVRSPG